MSHIHLNRELLRAIDRGESSPHDLVGAVVAHLFDLCPRCRQELEDYRREAGAAGSQRYELTIERVRDRARGLTGETPLVKRVAEQRRSAQHRIAELLALAPEERLDRLRAAPERYCGPMLAELLIEEARECLPGHPRRAGRLASLARTVLEHGSHTPRTAELYARALAHSANALRVQSELARADELLGQARFLLRGQTGPSDPLVGAEIDSLEGSLRRDQRRLDEAEKLFTRAAAAWAREREETRAARELLNLGTVFRERGEIERAIEITVTAADCLDPETEPGLALYARHNLADSLNDAGRHEEARSLLEECRLLYERHGDPLTNLRRLWLEGKIAGGLGEIEGAEHALLVVRDGFLGQGIGYDAALASLDLAHLYARAGRTTELKRLAEEIAPVFEARDVHREAVTALMLFQDAVRAEHLTLGFLHELGRYLEAARRDPGRAFRAPS